MRIALAFALLLAVTAPEARAQGAPWRPAAPRMETAPPGLSALDGIDLAPASLRAAAEAVRVEAPRDHVRGALLGIPIGAIAGWAITSLVVCRENYGEGDARSVCHAAGLIYGAVGGAIVGGVVGWPRR